MLIDEPDSSIVSVAYNVGFNSPSSFYKAFNEKTGLKPFEFRKKNFARDNL
jgi:AraC-like DNA-binding protein